MFRTVGNVTLRALNGKPKESVRLGNTEAFGLPLNNSCLLATAMKVQRANEHRYFVGSAGSNCGVRLQRLLRVAFQELSPALRVRGT